jgi:hypothetical protein
LLSHTIPVRCSRLPCKNRPNRSGKSLIARQRTVRHHRQPRLWLHRLLPRHCRSRLLHRPVTRRPPNLLLKQAHQGTNLRLRSSGLRPEKNGSNVPTHHSSYQPQKSFLLIHSNYDGTWKGKALTSGKERKSARLAMRPSRKVPGRRRQSAPRGQ